MTTGAQGQPGSTGAKWSTGSRLVPQDNRSTGSNRSNRAQGATGHKCNRTNWSHRTKHGSYRTDWCTQEHRSNRSTRFYRETRQPDKVTGAIQGITNWEQQEHNSGSKQQDSQEFNTGSNRCHNIKGIRQSATGSTGYSRDITL